MATVNLKLNTRREKKDGNYPIVIEVRYRGKRTRQGAGVNSTKEQWSEAAQNIKTRLHPGGKVVYMDLQAIKLQMQQKLYSAELAGLSAEQFFNQLEGEGLSLFNFVDRLVNEFKAGGKIGNSEAYRQLLAQLKKYKADMPLASVDYNYISDFKQVKYVSGNNKNTIRYYLKTLRAVINEAIRRGYFKQGNYPFIKGLMPAEQTTKKRFLTSADIERLEAYKTKWPGKRLALDVFLLGFYLRGADIVDLAHLTAENIKRGRVEYRRQKSGQLLSVKLLPKAAEILERYKGQKYLLPVIDVPLVEDLAKYQLRRKNLNRSLKNIGLELGLPIALTTKVNRHSWATIAKSKGVSKDIIKEALGHQDKTVTDVYLGAYAAEEIDAVNALVCG